VVKHPGTIEFVDGASGRVTSTERAEDVPEAIAFARGEDGGPRPVTRIVVITDGDRREIRSYGPDGEFLTATHQIAE
jgi:hypothetical protein